MSIKLRSFLFQPLNIVSKSYADLTEEEVGGLVTLRYKYPEIYLVSVQGTIGTLMSVLTLGYLEAMLVGAPYPCGRPQEVPTTDMTNACVQLLPI